MEKVFCSVAQVRDGIKDGFHVYFSVSEKLIFELNFLWLQLLNRLQEIRILHTIGRYNNINVKEGE